MSHQIHNRSAAPPNLSVVRWLLCTCRPPEVLSIECRSVSLRRVKTLHKLYAEILIYYASTLHLQSLLSQYVTLIFVWLFEALIQLVLYDFELVSFDKKNYIYGTSLTFHQFKLLQLFSCYTRKQIHCVNLIKVVNLIQNPKNLVTKKRLNPLKLVTSKTEQS